MKTIAIQRLRKLAISKGDGLTIGQQVQVLSSLAAIGYRLTNPSELKRCSSSILYDFEGTLNILNTGRGGNVVHVGLFKSFPDNIPSDIPYLLKRMVGFAANIKGKMDKDDVVLSNGVVVPKQLFSVYDFGADPITQFQSQDLFVAAVKEQRQKKGDKHTEWIDLTLAPEAEIIEELKALLCSWLYSKSAIKSAYHSDVETLIKYLGVSFIDTSQLLFKETKALVMKSLWQKEDYDTVEQLCSSPTDVLRLFAALTDSDVSLAAKVKFPKMSRKQRKVVLGILEKSNDLAEAIKQYSRLWLEIGRFLHPGEYATRFPKVARVFNALRNGKIETFSSQTEALLIKGEINALIEHIVQKPGVFARKLHESLRKFPKHAEAILRAFEGVGQKVQLKNLLVMKAYFETINSSMNRTVVNKKGKMIVLPNNAHNGLPTHLISKISVVLERLIATHLTNKTSWATEKVWIDEALMNYTVPLQQRTVSDGLLNVGRGSRVKVDFSKVMRLFVYWKDGGKRTDLDLSLIQFDDSFKYINHVSYTQLKTDGITHSGDIQSAPLGASEFMDIAMDKVKKNVRYLAIQVYRYSGNHFNEMDCHAGWMMREYACAAVRTFDTKTVANKFDMKGRGAYAIPLVVDLKRQEVIFTDIYVSGAINYNRVEGALQDVSTLCSELAQFTVKRPNMHYLAAVHSEARGATLTTEKEEATITFGVKDATYSVDDVEQILNELI